MDRRELESRYSTEAIIDWIRKLRDPPRRSEPLPTLTEGQLTTLSQLRSFQEELLVDVAASARYVTGDIEAWGPTEFRRLRYPLAPDTVAGRFLSEMHEQVVISALPLDDVLPGTVAVRRLQTASLQAYLAEGTYPARYRDAYADEIFLSFLAWFAGRSDEPLPPEYYSPVLGEPASPAPRVALGLVFSALLASDGEAMETNANLPAMRSLMDLLRKAGIAVTPGWVGRLVFIGGNLLRRREGRG
jgi:hypothetical protein